MHSIASGAATPPGDDAQGMTTARPHLPRPSEPMPEFGTEPRAKTRALPPARRERIARHRCSEDEDPHETILLAGAIALALSTAGCGSGSEPERTATETVRPAAGTLPAPEVATCSSRSEASFPGAFQDPANAVVGPFVLVGGARPTSAAVVASIGGQKHPVLVRAGRTVTVRVPPGARDHVSLGYGSLPQGRSATRTGIPP